MSYIVYLSEECIKETQKHNVYNEMERLKKSIEEKQILSGFDNFPLPYWVKKKFGGKQGRLIAKTVSYNEHTIVVFLGFLTRGDRNYDKFGQDPKNIGESLFKGRYTDEDISVYVEERFKENPPKEKEFCDSAYLSFLNLHEVPSGLSDQKEQMIYESPEWIASIGEMKSNLNRICNRISDLTSKNPSSPSETHVDDRDGIRIYYRFLESRDLFLIDIKPSDGDSSPHPNSTDLPKESDLRKGYPAYILADPDSWQSIEMDAKNNYVLSPEEQSVFSHAVKDRKFPLFINGRAGSGKTTILQYVFSEYAANTFLMDEDITPPIYFTYSDRLREEAFKFVNNLFENNAKFKDLSQDKLSRLQDNAKKKLHFCFWEWRSYLKSLIIDPDKKKYFENNDKHIKYGIFKEKWLEKWGKNRDICNNFGADMSWHVIRTYIKGLNPDDYTDTEDYESIERKLRTVDNNTYEQIFQKVWPWYKELCEAEGYWDDQDLARYALEENLAKPEFPGIFCDEAQDFTRIEIELILRLSYFSDKQVDREHITKIPFIFSGDELQTLNPTGFRWDALKAWFSEKFLAILNEGRGKSIQDEQFKTLATNYRSPKAITNFCNIFQLFRSVHFRISGIIPQEAWDNDPTPRVFYYEAEDSLFWDHIKNITNALFIIPCDEGAEETWKNKDDILKKMKTQGRDVSILSSALAKGQEFPWVVLYKFGAESPLYDYTKFDQDIADSLQLQMEYYINKAYVAASRATQNLIILDTKKDSLWQLFEKNNKIIPSIISLGNQHNQTRWDQDKNLFYFDDGTSDNLNPGKKVNPRETAEKLKELGLSKPDAWTLKQATIAYHNIGDVSAAKECEAYAFFFEKKFKEAGEAFEACGKLEFALEAYWLSQNVKEVYRKICNIVEKHPRFQNSPIYFFAIALTQSSDPWIFTKALTSFASYDIPKEIPQVDLFLHQETLEKALNQLFQKIEELEVHNFLNDNLIEKVYQKIKKLNYHVKCSPLGLFAYNLGNPQRAVSIWENEDQKHSEYYFRAKAQITPYPESITYYYTIKDWDSIIKCYDEYKNISTESDPLLKIAEAYCRLEQYETAISFISYFTSEKDISMFKILFKDNLPLYDRIEYQELYLICKSQNWDAIANKIKDISSKNVKSVCIFTQFLARMDMSILPDTPSKNEGDFKITRRDISDFLVEKVLPHAREFPIKYVFEIGAAFEKSFNHVNALEYYEIAIANYNKNNSVVTDLKKRWIVCKERHAEFTKDLRRKKEALQARHALGLLEKDDLSNFPNISSLSELLKDLTSPSSKRIKQVQNYKNAKEFQLGGFSGAYNVQHYRLNLTEISSSKTISINNGKFQSFDDFTTLSLSDNTGEYFKIEKTKLMYRISEGTLVLWEESKAEKYLFDLQK